MSINQVHSSKVISAKHSGYYDSSDGIINYGGDLVCSIKVADCLPIYFINNFSKTIGLVHAGWRGLSLGIIKRYIDKVRIKNESAADNYVLIGPSIKNCCFRIQKDVIDHFDSKFYSKISDKHYQADLQGWAVNQIMDLDIEKNKILDEILEMNEEDFILVKDMFFDVTPVSETGVKSCMYPYYEIKRIIYNIRNPQEKDNSIVYSGIEALGWLWL